MTKQTSLPVYSELLNLYEQDQQIREYTQNNHNYWSYVHGAYALVQENEEIDFKPEKEYWPLIERRLIHAFFAKRLREMYSPANALRSLAFKVFRHFDQARHDRRLGTETSYESLEFLSNVQEVAKEIPDLSEYRELKTVWGSRIKFPAIKDDLASFLQEISKTDNVKEVFPAFYKKIPWFPYLGLRDSNQLFNRQRFFYGFYNLFTSTNSYLRGGSQTFAQVLQNNGYRYLISFVREWLSGASPLKTGFEVDAKYEKGDKSLYSAVVELYGFLNLHHIPFYNNITAPSYDSFKENGDEPIYLALERIGALTKRFLNEAPQQVIPLSKLFRNLAEKALQGPFLIMEGLRTRSSKIHREELAEDLLIQELHKAALARSISYSDVEAATAMLHILMDAVIYTKRNDHELPPAPPAPDTSKNGREDISSSPPQKLPQALLHIANDALGYLRAGHHVLFAGPPGTGKTTVAQFVAYAWNRRLATVPSEMSASDAPATTVGNSAWSPFHTIGGILPAGDGSFRVHRGIFIDPDSSDAANWALRPDCLILDEMNRADLDRCIGELYPLLSNSVQWVHPAGIPGVNVIRSNPSFRLVATVNDTTLDDVVFPISEGLSRRFVRLEMKGARKEELKAAMSSGDVLTDRAFAAEAALDQLFDVCEEAKLIQTSELGDYIPFGVGYFELLRRWVKKELNLSLEFNERELNDQARQIMIAGLRSAARFRGLRSIIEKLAKEEGQT